MNLEYKLNQDFMLFLDLLRQPNKVFTPHSFEYEVTMAWINLLCRYPCESLEERRLRNKYMSYMVVCLNERRLREPFTEMPRENVKLTETDFDDSNEDGGGGGGGAHDSEHC